MRTHLTPAEATLWSRVRRKQLGVKFRRQHVLVPYIVDFYSYSKKLVVEVDGGMHEVLAEADASRDRRLREDHGVVAVLRFSNQAVAERLEEVIERIRSALTKPAK